MSPARSRNARIDLSVSRELLARCLALARADFDETDWEEVYGRPIGADDEGLSFAAGQEDDLLAAQIRLILDLEFELAPAPRCRRAR